MVGHRSILSFQSYGMSLSSPSVLEAPADRVLGGKQSTIRGGREWRDFVQPVLDSFSVVSALLIVKWAAGGEMAEADWVMSLIAVILFFLASPLTGLHRRDHGWGTDGEMMGIASTWVLTVLLLGAVAFLTRYGGHFSRGNVVAWILISPALIGMSRMLLRIVQSALLRRGVGVRNVAIVGWNPLGLQTRVNLESEPSLGLRFAGFYDDRTESRQRDAMKAFDPQQVPGLHENSSALEDELPVSAETGSSQEVIAGSLPELVEAARRGEIQTILVTLPMRAEGRIRKLLDQLSDTTASVYIVPDFFVFELLHSRWTHVGGLPAVSVFENPLFGINGAAKRATDIVLAICGLALLSVPMLMIAVLIKATSPGPVFFRQRRYGLDGQVIRVWKFRSMRTCDDGAVVKQATQNDSRVTRVGAVLRRTSLDELPQLFNVLQGSMSLVGPRPHASAHNEQYRRLIRGYMLRHKVKPGITGWAQVNGCRGETETVEKMKRRIDYDHQYIRFWSLGLDLRILFRTLWVAWKQPEAY